MDVFVAHPVSASPLRIVQRLIGGLDHVRRWEVPPVSGGDANTHCHREPGCATLFPRLPGLVLGPIATANGEVRFLDVAPETLEVRLGFIDRLQREENGEFLAAVAVGTAAPPTLPSTPATMRSTWSPAS